MRTALALVAGPRTIEQIEADIAQGFASIAHLTKTMKATRLQIRARAVNLGGFLEEMKARVGHGNFEPWREARGYPSSTATRYMRIFRHKDQIHRLADLTIEQADRIAREIEQVTTEGGELRLTPSPQRPAAPAAIVVNLGFVAAGVRMMEREILSLSPDERADATVKDALRALIAAASGMLDELTANEAQ